MLEYIRVSSFECPPLSGPIKTTKNKFIKWPNVILNLHNYNCDQMDRTQLDICKYPLIGLDDNLEQEEFLI